MNRDEGIGSFGLGAPRRSHRRLAVPEGEPLGLGRGNRRHRHQEAGDENGSDERRSAAMPSDEQEATGHRTHSQGFRPGG
jgi:hypothetical protein